MKDKGAALNERVWRLFQKAGFETKPNSSDPSEEVITLPSGMTRPVDLSASIKNLGVKIIGQNTTRKQLGQSWSAHVHDLVELVKSAKANAGLWVLTRKEVSERARKFAQDRGIRVWGREELRYYEVLVDAIGEYAKGEIIYSFGIQTKDEQQTYRVLALKLHQPDAESPVSLFMFTIPPEKLLKTCAVLRKARGSSGAYQRILRKDRFPGISRFIAQKDTLLPTNIIVHLSDKVTCDTVKIPELLDENERPITLTRGLDYELVTLNIPLAYASIELMDGQHRLYGFIGTDPEIRRNYNLVVLGIKGLPFEKRRDTFVDINDRSRRVDPNLVAYLKYTDNEVECQRDNELMAIKVVVELNKRSPFEDKIRLVDIVGDQKITLKGFAGYDLKGLLGRRGLLRKYYPNKSKEYVSALRLYFGVLRSLFKQQWERPEKYIIFTNRGISAFLKLLKSILKTCQSPLTEQIVLKYLQPLRDKRSDSRWETAQLSSAYVGAKGWKDFHRDLVRIIQKRYPEFEA